MIAILSIKTQYVKEILNGNKKYEFRKTSFKKDVEEILVYVTKPVGKFVCKFYVGEIIKDTPENLWRSFRDSSGLTKEGFFTYFSNRKKGVAIEIRDVEEFSKPINPKTLFPKFTPPQSWMYVPKEKERISETIR
ncbi:MAG: hypothetical protein CVT90_00935 [Candidatus Altiarchaeales archaeon HGW-Altiarchaeales-3]|nr:MAG: hypothetical protein CVT90_00935 [Candidatus Altiarchaeales archaeon HGW-Altiarchaeales-3]